MRLALALLVTLALTLPASAAPAPVINVVAELAERGELGVTLSVNSSAEPGAPARLRLDVPPELRLLGVAWSGVTPTCQLKRTPPQWLACTYLTPASGQLGALVVLEPGERPGCAGGAAVLAQVFTGESSGLARAWVPLPKQYCVYAPIISEGATE